ncbi:putative ATP-dependent endonuclease of the OLD family [Butyrivibrio fibrisolvens]|uniref:Putative ATP-dependent endonuclease of the OLD family n=1 Tax=Butyrivibrio fibrisolvens TaxID=831 RepID=A0A1H9XA18_BUTFI|nr:AAA family ATPase [Butyrivibrio fibrisolvens]SES43058.1 putative ATP-dependent endonuclease of the OLD family [Butyrivibrio fibrisolvens]
MEFKSISINNFRNFEEVTVDLSNKNIFFGMNDVGKTNFLYALRYVFDKEVRKNELLDSDFYQKNTAEPIDIVVAIDISDVADSDSQKLRARVKGNITSGDNIVYIKLHAVYNPSELIAVPEMYWGGDLNNLGEMKAKSTYFELDYVFNPIYIDAYVDLNTLFRKNSNQLIVSQDETDEDTITEIEGKIRDLNETIGSLSGVKAFEDNVTPEYKKFKNEDIEVSVKSEIAIKGLYSNIVPYIKKNGEDLLYPTAGEGRKKLLVYSIYDLLAGTDQNAKKINIFLIEEPENHLHRSMQMAISRVLFGEDNYKYLFVTTHSPLILTEMDNVNLVRVFNEGRLDTRGVFYKVPDEYKQRKKMLNRGLSEAIFAKKVLLVEGPSENVLFTKVLSEIKPDYEVDGVFILPVNGIAFRAYKEILEALDIKTIIKTDNDLRKTNISGQYSVLGFLRVNGYVTGTKLPVANIPASGSGDINAKRDLYDRNRILLDQIREEDGIFLSHCGLEEDLDELLHDEMVVYLPDSNGNPINYLQDSKNYHMVELVDKLSIEDCQAIYDDYNFACLKEVMEG